MNEHREGKCRLHQFYKSVWEPEKCEKIDCHKEDCDETCMYDSHVFGVYKQEKDSTLVDHVPIECSTLLDNLFKG